MAASSTGKAAIITKWGGAEGVSITPEHVVRAPEKGELLIKLVATSVNPVDVYVRSGKYNIPLPVVVGGDASGNVIATGEGSKFIEGDSVFALSDSFYPSASKYSGTYAEYALVKEEWAAPAPDPSVVSLVNAAAIPLVSLTALQALEKAAPKPGQRVLVFGASGGVGHVAVQLAKQHFGLHVTAVTSRRHTDFVRSLGPDEVWEYDTAGGPEGLKAAFEGKQFDIVFDVVSGPLLDSAIKYATKPGGIITHVRNRGADPKLDEGYTKASEAGTGPKYVKTLVQPSGEQLRLLRELVNQGKLVVNVARVFPLEDAGKAQDIVIDGHAGGKVVLTM